MNDDAFKTITETLQNGGIAVVRTDTIYGIITLAANEQAVENVYVAKHRDPSKQCIVLVGNAEAVGEYGARVAEFSSPDQRPTSVIVPATTEPDWLLRGGATIAYRVVRDAFLRSVVEAVGPVIAPSANPEGLEPARTIEEARQYFGDLVDCYVDGGEVPEGSQASRIIEILSSGEVKEVRS